MIIDGGCCCRDRCGCNRLSPRTAFLWSSVDTGHVAILPFRHDSEEKRVSASEMKEKVRILDDTRAIYQKKCGLSKLTFLRFQNAYVLARATFYGFID